MNTDNARRGDPQTPALAVLEGGIDARERRTRALETVAAYRDGEASRDLLESVLAGTDLVGADLSGLDLSGLSLAGANLARANLDDVVGVGLDLAGASLVGATARGAELACASLESADLRDADFSRAGLGRASLDGVDAAKATFRGASCVEMSAAGADFDGADLASVRLTRARLDRASFVAADLTEVDLTEATVDRANFHRACLSSAHVRGLKDFRTAHWIGADIRGVDDVGIDLWRTFVREENFLDEFRRQSRRHEWIYRMWWMTSDCGRSAVRWGLCSAVIVTLFALIYCGIEIDFGESQTALAPLYFSVVTFTTLGYGDILPRTSVSQGIVIAEVIVGYVMLGGLLSVVGSKLGSRGSL
ncbi:MAG: pentapeptide repeat-containing protein [Planctomycetota bacterium]